MAVDDEHPGENLELSEDEGLGPVLLLIARLALIFLGLSFICFVDSVNHIGVRVKVKGRFIFFLETLEHRLQLGVRQFLLKRRLETLDIQKAHKVKLIKLL